MKQILLVEDHSIVRLATRFLIKDIHASAQISESTDFYDTIEKLGSGPFDLIILDIDIPGGEGQHMITRIREIQPDVRILIFSAMDEAMFAPGFLRAGANGFVTKNATHQEVREAIASVLEHGEFVSKAIQEQLSEPSTVMSNPLDNLSQRELEVMDLLLEGKWAKEIAIALNISGSSVSTYKARIFDKMHVTSMIELFVKVQKLKSWKTS